MDKKIALVTGASRGIGRAIALQLASDGYFVVINYCRNKNAAEETQNLITLNGGTCMVLPFDVSIRNDVQTAIKKLTKSQGPIEVLVNNAGIIRDQPLMRMRDEDWDDVIATNLTGLYYCSKATLKTWAGKKKGQQDHQHHQLRCRGRKCFSDKLQCFKRRYYQFYQILSQRVGSKKNYCERCGSRLY